MRTPPLAAPPMQRETRVAARILVTGVAGFLGAHVAAALVQAGFEVVGIDNLCTGDRQTLARLQHLCGERLAIERSDLREPAPVLRALARHKPAAVLHLALLPPDAATPIAYYDNHVHGLTTLLAAMSACNVHTLVMGSSGALYGARLRGLRTEPADEHEAIAPQGPHGHTLAACEQLLGDLGAADRRWRIGVLRVFQPLGAHESGLIGDFAPGARHVMARALDVATGRSPRVMLGGGTWPTADGTRAVDVVHVSDVAQGFLRALEALARGTGSFTANLGRGAAATELQLLGALERVCRRALPFELGPAAAAGATPAGLAVRVADVRRAATLLGWRAQHDLERICRDAWRARRLNRRGFSEQPAAAPSPAAL